ncbi:hypothetical protein, partial [Dyella sp.]|uniref:hypothetical protein n=1 Tax=Dyella sp. TaxID=1869338 RepID=UPI002ED607D3
MSSAIQSPMGALDFQAAQAPSRDPVAALLGECIRSHMASHRHHHDFFEYPSIQKNTLKFRVFFSTCPKDFS